MRSSPSTCARPSSAYTDQARVAAGVLAGYGLSLERRITAPAKVRNAYAELPRLVSQRQAIYTARRQTNQLGRLVPVHDE